MASVGHREGAVLAGVCGRARVGPGPTGVARRGSSRSGQVPGWTTRPRSTCPAEDQLPAMMLEVDRPPNCSCEPAPRARGPALSTRPLEGVLRSSVRRARARQGLFEQGEHGRQGVLHAVIELVPSSSAGDSSRCACRSLTSRQAADPLDRSALGRRAGSRASSWTQSSVAAGVSTRRYSTREAGATRIGLGQLCVDPYAVTLSGALARQRERSPRSTSPGRRPTNWATLRLTKVNS